MPFVFNITQSSFFPLFWVSTPEKEAVSVTQTLERHNRVYQRFIQILLTKHHIVLDFIVCPLPFLDSQWSPFTTIMWKPLGGNLIPVIYLFMQHKEADQRPNVIEKSCRFICLCPYRTCLKYNDKLNTGRKTSKTNKIIVNTKKVSLKDSNTYSNPCLKKSKKCKTYENPNVRSFKH